jgi:LPS O-antigen subunit length determinant protein (WzzB/FepE family)
MKVRLIIVLFEILTVTLLVALVACSSPTYESELTIDQIKARSLSALELIETYRLDMTVSMGISAGSEVTINQLSSRDLRYWQHDVCESHRSWHAC